MYRTRKIRFIEPMSRPGRPFNAWIRRWPLLGPIVLATILRRRGYDVAVLNENISGSVVDDPEVLADICSSDVVGISIMTPTANRGYFIADRIRSLAPDVTVVFGGVHATFCPQEALVYGDVVVRGEGETIIESVASGEIDRGIVTATPLENLDEIPTLDHSVMRDFDKLQAGSRRRELYPLPVMTSRGCPHGCTYCSVTRMFGRKVRRQSVEKVYEDMCRYAERGFGRVFFYDDNFTTDRAWTRRLLERLAPMRMRFEAQARVDFYWQDGARRRRDERLLKLMRRAGGDILYVGYETIDDSTARRWRKGYRGPGSLEKRLREDTKALHESGFWVHGMFVLGPEHDKRTAETIVDFARRSHIESMQISILTPLPGTPLMEEMAPKLVFADYPADWDYYDGTHCVYNHGRLNIEETQRVVLKAHQRFYGWSGWSARRIRALLEQRIPAWCKLAQLWANARTARTVLQQWRREIEQFLEVVKVRTAT